jgi:hypothetical protein
MKVENIQVEHFVDYLNGRIHLLEKGLSTYSNSLPNIIGPEFQKSFIEREQLLIDVMDFDWVCYCSNRLILLFKGHSLTLIPNEYKTLHKPFLDVLESR